MVNDRLRPARMQRHVQRGNHQVTGHTLPKGPAHHLAAVHIHHNRQVQEPSPGRHVGHVSHPQLIDACGFELTFDQIGRCLGLAIPLRGHHIAPAPAHPAQACQFHQACNALVIDAKPHVTELGLYAVAPVGAITHGVNLSNLLGHDAVLDAALAGCTGAPLVIPTGGHCQVLAHSLDGKVGLVRLDQRIDVLSMLPSLFANQAVAFANMSRSRVTWRNWRRSCANSWRSAVVNGASGLPPPRPSAWAWRTQALMLVSWQPNSLANSPGLRPTRTNSTICWRNSGAYAPRLCLIFNSFDRTIFCPG